MAFKDRLYETPVIGTALRVQDRHKADAGDQFAAAIGFFGFLSLFPLLIIALSVVGFVLAGRPAGEAATVAEAITDAIPGFAAVLGADCPAGDASCSTGIARALDTIVENRGSIGLIGLVSLLLTGLRVTNAAQTATLKIFGVDLLAMQGWRLKARQLVALVALGVLALLGAAASSSVGYVIQLDPTGATALLAPAAGIGVTFLADFVLFLAAYKLFLARHGPAWRKLAPGAALAAVGWAALKLFGSTYVSGQVADASELYGALGGVIGLLLLFYLAGRLFVYGAELSVVRLEEADADRPGAEAVAVAAEPAGGEGAGETTVAEDVEGDATTAAGPSTVRSQRSVAVDTAIRQRLAASPTAAQIAETARVERLTPAMAAARAGRDDHVTAAAPDPALAERARRVAAPPDGGPRQATAFVLALAAVGGLVAALKPWRRD